MTFSDNVQFDFNDDLDVWGETPYHVFQDEKYFYLMPRKGGELNDVKDIEKVASKFDIKDFTSSKFSFIRQMRKIGGNALSGARLQSLTTNLGQATFSRFRRFPSNLKNNLGNLRNLTAAKKQIDDLPIDETTGAMKTGAAKQIREGGAEIAEGAKKRCKTMTCSTVRSLGNYAQRNPMTVIIGVGVGTYFAINHANKEAMEQQCIAFCLPKKWEEFKGWLDESPNNNAPNLDQSFNCDSTSANVSSTGNPPRICFRDIDSLINDPEFELPNEGPIFPADWTANNQPFCTLEDYNETKPKSGKDGGKCEDACAARCAVIHRSAFEAVTDTAGTLLEVAQNLLENGVHCLPGGDALQCPVTSWAKYIIYAIVGLVILMIVLPLIRGFFS